MKLLVLGATGGTGREVVRQAPAKGHAVTALVRTPAKLADEAAAGALRLLTGSLPGDVAALDEALAGQDAVISALGVGTSRESGGLLTRSMEVLVPAMQRHGVSRLLVVSAFGVGETRRDVPLVPRIAQRLFLSQVFADKAVADDLVRASPLDWTLVHPSVLVDGPATGRWRAGERLAMSGVPRIRRADVAAFLLDELARTQYLRKSVLVSQ